MTQDRADFVALTVAFFESGRPHAGLALIPSGMPTNRFTAIARAIAALAKEHGEDLMDYAIVYLPRTPNE